MLRIMTFAFFIATLGMAGVLFKIKYDTRSLQLEMVQLRQQISVERQQVAVLKAEWSILTTPKRIDKIARQIGLIPLAPEQIISFRDLEALPMDHSRPFASMDNSGEPAVSVIGEVDVVEGKDEDLRALKDFGLGVDAELAGGKQTSDQVKKHQKSNLETGANFTGKQDRLPGRREAVTEFIKRASFEGRDLNQLDISNSSGEVKNAN